jgi:protein O-mannosyl-transferase
LLIGWLWFIVMLIPVIGIIQSGRHGHADRYTYLSQIGLCIAGTWLVGNSRLEDNAIWLRWVVGVVLLMLISLAWRQVGYWRDSEILWEHALDVAPANSIALMNYGDSLAKKKKFEKAILYFRKAYEINPNYQKTRANLVYGLTSWGDELASKGQMEEAARCFEEALAFDFDADRIRKQLVMINQIMGVKCAQQKRLTEAVMYFNRAAELDANNPTSYYNLGRVFIDLKDPQAALACFRRVLELDPNNMAAQRNIEILAKK